MRKSLRQKTKSDSNIRHSGTVTSFRLGSVSPRRGVRVEAGIIFGVVGYPQWTDDPIHPIRLPQRPAQNSALYLSRVF
jgi:hypothetical protein